MIVYGSSLSPFVRKVIVFANEKGIEIENRQVSRHEPDPEFVEASPFGKVPAFRDGDFVIPDSSAIVHYLEALKPQPALIPSEPRERARTIWFEEFADTMLVPAGAQIFVNRFLRPRVFGQEGDLALADKAEREKLPPLYDYLETQISDAPFLVGGRITLADIAVTSPIATLSQIGLPIDAKRWPRTASYSDAVLARDSFARIMAAEAAFIAKRA